MRRFVAWLSLTEGPACEGVVNLEWALRPDNPASGFRDAYVWQEPRTTGPTLHNAGH